MRQRDRPSAGGGHGALRNGLASRGVVDRHWATLAPLQGALMWGAGFLGHRGAQPQAILSVPVGDARVRQKDRPFVSSVGDAGCFEPTAGHEPTEGQTSCEMAEPTTTTTDPDIKTDHLCPPLGTRGVLSRQPDMSRQRARPLVRWPNQRLPRRIPTERQTSCVLRRSGGARGPGGEALEKDGAPCSLLNKTMSFFNKALPYSRLAT